MSDDRSVSEMIETAEAELMYQYESVASAETKNLLGIATTRIGGGVALSMRNDVTGYWSKALGFGFGEPVTAKLIDQLIEFYRAERSPGFVLQIAPSALPADWEVICLRHGLRADSHWAKLACPLGAFRADGTSALRVGAVAPGEFGTWASTALRGFGMPTEGLADMMAAGLTHPGSHPFAAWDGDAMVATANLFLHGEVGSLNTAATLAGHQNRGAQSALIAARAAAAADAGCRWLCAETGKPGDGEINHSLNNLQRFGLKPVYYRQNWIWSGDEVTPDPR